MFAGIQYIALADYADPRVYVYIIKLLDQSKGFIVAHYRHSWVSGYQIANTRGMVGFHVLNYQVIQIFAAQRMDEVFCEALPDSFVDRVKQDGLFILQEV